MMPNEPEQCFFNWQHSGGVKEARHFLLGSSNQPAIQFLKENSSKNLSGFIALIGPAKSGKSLFLHEYARSSGAVICDGIAVSGSDNHRMEAILLDPKFTAANFLVLDHLEAIPHASGLFLLLSERGQDATKTTLLCSNQPLIKLELALKDLRSRLSNMVQLVFEEPDEILFEKILNQELKLRGLSFESGLAEYCQRRLEHSYTALRDLIEWIDCRAWSLARAHITRKFLHAYFEQPEQDQPALFK